MAGENQGGAILLVAGIPVLTLGLVFSLLLFSGSAGAACNPPSGGSTSVTIDPATVPAGPIAGYSGDQLVNAAYVLKAGADLGLGVRDQTIGVMTAMGESSLVNVNYGDDLHGVTNPDGTLTCSLGLFQQQWCLGWGTKDEVMDPYISSTKFFTAMMKVENRDSLEPTAVAHRTQRNANPFHYAKYWDAAVAVVEQLSGVDTGLTSGNGNQVCAGEGGATVPGQVNDGGWATPGAGPVKSKFGMRRNPGQINHGELRLHAGTDLAAGSCNGPIWSARAGTVIFAGLTSPDGLGIITVDHGDNIKTKYLHMYRSGILVSVGDKVAAGQQIGRTGSSGNSTGCHLHYEVHLNGKPVDPEPFMAEVGIKLG